MRSCRFVRSALLPASVIFLGTAPFAARQAAAAANAGGTLIVQDLHLTVSATNTAVCLEAQPPASCEQADSRVDGALSSDPALFMVYAAFPEQGAPRLLGVTWGVEYDPGLILSDHGRCGDFELDDPEWPASGAGSSITWNEVQTSSLVAVYWFAAYPATPGASASFAAVAHHDFGGTFGDDSVPALLDVIAGYGTLGFGQEGAISCPPGLAGACCDPQAITCTQEDALECASHGGLYVGPAVPCDPGTCATAGACCDIAHGGLCLADLSAAACADSIHGYFGGVGSRCEDLSCVDYGACCRGTTCTLTTLGECEPSGIYAGFLTWCDPLGAALPPSVLHAGPGGLLPRGSLRVFDHDGSRV